MSLLNMSQCRCKRWMMTLRILTIRNLHCDMPWAALYGMCRLSSMKTHDSRDY